MHRGDQHEQRHLASRHACGAQEPDVAGAFRDRHRQRVEDEERSPEEREGRDERDRDPEVRGGCPQPGDQLVRRRQGVRLHGEPAFERRRHGGDTASPDQAEVHEIDGVRAEQRLGSLERHDDAAAGRVGVVGNRSEDP